jgi:hypothetical protein
MRLNYRRSVSLDEGPCSRGDPEDGAGPGVLRPRLVTAGSGGPGNRRSGTTTRLRTCRSRFGANAGAEKGEACGSRNRKRQDGAPGRRLPLCSWRGMRRLVTGATGGPCQSARAPRRGARRLPGAPCPSPCEGEGKRERATPGARKCKCPGGVALATGCLTSEYDRPACVRAHRW